ncbi:hypothetical protein [Flavobacterium sp. PS2]|uniref:hypothetical protein n=1 Tax=Flavobacterium sp. PS2 TaxID=3384157 RepID=UPI00390C6204
MFGKKNRDSGPPPPPPNLSHYIDLGDSTTNNNLATTASLLGGASGLMNELSVVKFYNDAPKGFFAVNYKGMYTSWTDSFKGGTRGNISYSFVQTAKAKASGVKLASKFGGYANILGGYVGYYGAVDNYFKGDYYGSVREGTGNYVGLELAAAKGNVVGIGWTIGWNILGPWVTNSEAYNNFFFGKNSTIYKNRERENDWYESKILKE